jgi:hypothetical protein
MFLKQPCRAAATSFVPVIPDEIPIIHSVAWGSRRIPLRRGSIRGFHPGLGDALQFESLLECDVISALLSHSELSAIQSQPYTIHFQLGETHHRYTPDLLVEFFKVPDSLDALGFRRLTVIECKPRAKLANNAALLGRAYAAIRQITSAPMLIVTDASLTSVSLGVAHDD